METNYTGIKTLETSTDSGPKHLGNLNFDNTYSRLPEIFFQEIAPKPVSDPKLVRLNTNLVKELGMDPSTVEARDLDILAGNAAPQESKQIAIESRGLFGNVPHPDSTCVSTMV